MTAREKDYVLGTHDDEIDRLGLQHRVWRPRVLDAWRRAGFAVGQTILDVGCGPGHATIDLAETVGPTGRVIAVDRSRRFLDALESVRNERGLDQIETRELDLDQMALSRVEADGVWCRWVFAFVKRPRRLLEQIASVLKPGGTLVLHEYFDYSTWRMAPRRTEIEEFVHAVMQSWRAEGGEPDIGLELAGWLGELGFTMSAMKPIIDVVSPTNLIWQWPRTFLHVGLRRLTDLGHITSDRARTIAQSFAACEAQPGSYMITPGVLEIVARRE